MRFDNRLEITYFCSGRKIGKLKIMRLSVLTQVVCISFLLSAACTKTEPVELMPVTTDSELAKEFYETGILAFDQLKWGLAWENFQLAVKEDPDFFMAHFWMYYISKKEHKKVAEKVLQSDAELNEAEQKIKSAFKYLMDGQDSKVLENLQAAVDLYPSDPSVYRVLYVIQFQMMKDMKGAIESIKHTVEAHPDFAPAYNYLGYALMDLGEYDEAEKAFDTYIRLAPNIANPYDSKGDFFMNRELYEEAYESYMKAFNIDSSFEVSKKKALKAKQLQEKSEISS
jgi:tetratricopeptide (TPR) repeat protein